MLICIDGAFNERMLILPTVQKGGSMGRKKIRRTVRQEPGATFYKPQGIPMRHLQDVTLSHDGLEALRLADGEGLSQEEGASLMGVSRPTFGRILAEARKVVAQALANGWAIRVDGGHIEYADEERECPKQQCGQ